MIEGHISDDLEAKIELVLELPNDSRAIVEAVVDTGYSGKLVLPRAFLDQWSLPVIGTRRVMLADGAIEEWPRYDVVIYWHDTRRHVEVLASEGEILIGMELLKGSQLTLDAVTNGSVRIQLLE